MASSEPGTPVTEAGRRMYRLLDSEGSIIDMSGVAESLAAIEVEAARSERERMRVAVEGLPTGDKTEARVREIIAEFHLDAEQTGPAPALERLARALARTEVASASERARVRAEIQRRTAETQEWIDTHPTKAAALNAVNGAAIAAFHEVLAIIDDAS